jgi:hypothetical protein
LEDARVGVLRVAGLEPGEAHLARAAQLVDHHQRERERERERDARAAREHTRGERGEPAEEREVGGGPRPTPDT